MDRERHTLSWKELIITKTDGHMDWQRAPMVDISRGR